MAQLLLPDADGITQAAALLRAGGLVAFPTETVYGLGANAFSALAVARIFAAKGRPYFDPLIVHVADPGEAARLWADVPPLAKKLMEKFWPGPLTLVLPKREIIPDIVTAGLPTVAVRMPSHPVALELIRLSKVPIAAPSANRFGRLSPTHHEAVLEQLGEAIDAVIAGGPTPVGIESTVISLAEDPPRLLRPGGTPIEALREFIPHLRIEPPCGPSASPGTMPRHYRPSTPLFLLASGLPTGGEALPRAKCGFLAFQKAWDGFAQVEVLSERGDLVEAASSLFAALRRLDRAGLRAIVAEPVPEEGLGLAIMDRLRRASSGQARLDETHVWVVR
ncbi:MAG: L-threonylcarbamoyladenylate synthase [Candidatus Bipolaricaulota bacterium]|nr:L-threonylcarbamoyladenylate synthase [Candidatus Bipolaricaulota bacterium]MDW8126658.1 L-threonylcarbamoyladenylate synthase [Candidatus Bipolaricaulota bacterium]